MLDLLLKDVLFILVFAIVNSTKLLSVTLQDLALFNYYVLLVIYMCFQYVLWFSTGCRAGLLLLCIVGGVNNCVSGMAPQVDAVV